MKTPPAVLALLVLLLSPLCSWATCYDYAAKQYGVHELLIRAVAKVESGMRPDQVNVNKDGSRDIGLMQINSRWQPTLASSGIDQAQLWNPCQNAVVGTWILANNLRRLGDNWDAVGAYNVGCARLSKDECAKRRNVYAWKVYRAMVALSNPAKQVPPSSGKALHGDLSAQQHRAVSPSTVHTWQRIATIEMDADRSVIVQLPYDRSAVPSPGAATADEAGTDQAADSSEDLRE